MTKPQNRTYHFGSSMASMEKALGGVGAKIVEDEGQRQPELFALQDENAKAGVAVDHQKAVDLPAFETGQSFHESKEEQDKPRPTMETAEGVNQRQARTTQVSARQA